MPTLRSSVAAAVAAISLLGLVACTGSSDDTADPSVTERTAQFTQTGDSSLVRQTVGRPVA